MPTLSLARISELLHPFVQNAEIPTKLNEQLSAYLDLLMRWNGRTNLTAIRDPEEIVRRHFGESVFAGLELRRRVPEASTLLDFGSGAGFPGLPMQLAWPELQITLAESQGKKAAFLRETIRVLMLPTLLWPRRVEDMPEAQRFDVVALRAVDKMEGALQCARVRAGAEGKALAASFPLAHLVQVPESAHRHLILTA